MAIAQKNKKNTATKKSILEIIVIWGSVLVLAVLPLLYFSDRVASYVTSKEYFLIGSVDILLVIWVWLLLADKRYRLSKKNILLLTPPFLFLLSLTVSAIVGVDTATSFFSIVESGTGLLLLYHVFLFTCIITSIVRVQQKVFLRYIFQATFFASVLLAIATFFTGNNGLVDLHSKMLDGSSGGAMMGNSLLVGAYFIFSVFLTLLLLLQESKVWKKTLYWFGIPIILFSPIYFNVGLFKGATVSSSYLFFGEARIAAVALIIGVFTSLFVWLCTNKEHTVRKIIGTIGIVFMILVAGIGIKEIATPTTPLHTFFIKESGNRIIDWQESVQGIKAKPLFGWGPENFHAVYQQYFNPIVLTPERGNEGWALHPHNNTLEVLVNGGIIGFIFYLLVLATLFGGLYILYRRAQIDAKTYSLFMGMVIAFIIQQQMIYDSIVSYIMLLTVMAIIAGLISTTDEQYSTTLPTRWTYLTGIAVTVVMIPVWLYAAYLPAQHTIQLQQVAMASSDKRTTEYQTLFHSAGSYSINTDAEFFTDPLLYSYDSQKEALKANPVYQKVSSGEIQALIAAVDPLWQQHTYDYHLSLSLVQLENLQFYLSNNPQTLVQADAYAAHGFLLSPTDPELYTAYAQTLVYEKNIPGAKALLDKALTLDPTYQSAINFKVLLNK